MAESRRQLVGRVHACGYHRNGISGEPFWQVVFDGRGDVAGRTFTAVVFEKERTVAVVDLKATVSHQADQTMRGDHFEAELRQVVEQWSRLKLDCGAWE